VVDGWAYDDLEQASDNRQTAGWSYVDKVIHRCRRCHYEWQSVDAVHPYSPAVAETTRPRTDALHGFSPPRSLADEAAIRAIPDEPGVHLVYDPDQRPLYVGTSSHSRTGIRQHVTGDREASILHEKVGRRLDRVLGRTASRDEIRDWLNGCTFTYRLTEDGPALKARLMDELDPELNEIRP
jgi:hypothetical protein